MHVVPTGLVTAVVCFLLLFCYHASRDALITALPTIANLSSPSNNETTQQLLFDNTHVIITNSTLILNDDSNVTKIYRLRYNKISDVILAAEQPLLHLGRRDRIESYGRNDAVWPDITETNRRVHNIRSASSENNVFRVSIHDLERLLRDDSINLYDSPGFVFGRLVPSEQLGAVKPPVSDPVIHFINF